jgi:hypothetical protein
MMYAKQIISDVNCTTVNYVSYAGAYCQKYSY